MTCVVRVPQYCTAWDACEETTHGHSDRCWVISGRYDRNVRSEGRSSVASQCDRRRIDRHRTALAFTFVVETHSNGHLKSAAGIAGSGDCSGDYSGLSACLEPSGRHDVSTSMHVRLLGFDEYQKHGAADQPESSPPEGTDRNDGRLVNPSRNDNMNAKSSPRPRSSVRRDRRCATKPLAQRSPATKVERCEPRSARLQVRPA